MKKREAKRAKRIGQVIIICLVIFTVSLIISAAITDSIMSSRIIANMSAELEAEIQKINVDGAEIAYRQLGNGEESLLLVHGFMGSSHDFNQVLPLLAEHFTVYAVDQIGFGLSDKSLELNYSKQHSAYLISEMMESLEIERFHLLGHSMGGEVAIHITLDRPDSVDKLILLNSAGISDMQNNRRNELPTWMIDRLLQNYLLQRLVFFRTVYDNKFANSDNFAGFFYFNKQIPAATLNRIIADNDSGSLGERIGNVRQPTLIIWGRQDKIILLEQGLQIERMIPGSQMIILEECGHLPYLEKPEELALEIISFFKN